MNEEQRLAIKESEDFSSIEVLRFLWSSRILITAITSIVTLIAIIYSLLLVDIYRSSALLSPASDSESSLSSKTTSSIGGLAALTGISLDKQSSQAYEAIEIAKSWGFVEDFIKDNELLVGLFAVKGWDEVSGNLIIDQDIFDPSTKEWKITKPSSFDAYEEFLKILSITQSAKTSLVSISIDHPSPIFAQTTVKNYVHSMNKHMSSRTINNVLRNIQFLQTQLDKTSVKEMQDVVYEIIKDQTRKIMLAEANSEYVFVTLNEPKVAENKIGPRRKVIVLLSAAFGLLFSLMICFFNFFVNRK